MSQDDLENRRVMIDRICHELRPDYQVNLFGQEQLELGVTKFQSRIYPLRGMSEHERMIFIEQITKLFDQVILQYMMFRK